MKIEFTNHAKFKINLLKKHGFNITEEEIVRTVKNPSLVKKGRLNRLIAERAINDAHILRVVYTIQKEDTKIITLYPARRGRYENKI
ncbi:MAG: DUF4258 domain-containing protein [Candidatus Odinarchaeia archaeon]